MPLNMNMFYNMVPSGLPDEVYAKAVELTGLMDSLESALLTPEEAWAGAGWGVLPEFASDPWELCWSSLGEAIFPALLEAAESYAAVDAVNAAVVQLKETERVIFFLSAAATRMILNLLFVRSQGLPSGLVDILLKEPSSISSFASSHLNILSESQVDELWDATKVALDASLPGWVSAESIAARNGGFHAGSEGQHPALLRDALPTFFSCLDASQRVLSEAAALTPLSDFKRVLTRRLGTSFGGSFKYPTSLDSPPVILCALQSAYFSEQVRLSGVDYEVVKMLIPSWGGTLTSLLDAALTLSADSVQA